MSRPRAAMAAFLAGLADEARSRGYRFNARKISRRRFTGQIPETSGQLLYEWEHLNAKLRVRAPQMASQLRSVTTPEPHPLSGEISHANLGGLG
jgi:hypothetical protein